MFLHSFSRIITPIKNFRLAIAKANLSKEDKVAMNSAEAREQAEALFKKTAAARLGGQKAIKEFEANIQTLREKTARLKALRLARNETNPKN